MLFQVEGMSCNHCKMAVENAVRSLNGVTDIVVDLAAHRVEVQGEVDPGLVRMVIEEAGYTVVE